MRESIEAANNDEFYTAIVEEATEQENKVGGFEGLTAKEAVGLGAVIGIVLTTPVITTITMPVTFSEMMKLTGNRYFPDGMLNNAGTVSAKLIRKDVPGMKDDFVESTPQVESDFSLDGYFTVPGFLNVAGTLDMSVEHAREMLLSQHPGCEVGYITSGEVEGMAHHRFVVISGCDDTVNVAVQYRRKDDTLDEDYLMY